MRSMFASCSSGCSTSSSGDEGECTACAPAAKDEGSQYLSGTAGQSQQGPSGHCALSYPGQDVCRNEDAGCNSTSKPVY
jgi:hypothetical protein